MQQEVEGMRKQKLKLLNKKGSVTMMEFVIVLLILTFFIFYPFAMYSSYQERDVLEDIKDRGLQLVATTGEVTNTIVDSIGKEFEFYGFKPKQGKQIVVTFYNTTQDEGEYNDGMLTSGKKTVAVFTTDSSKKLTWDIVHNDMTKALRKNQDIIRMTIQYPSDGFLNGTLRMIGKKLENENDTGAKLAFKVSGFIMSEYVD